MIARAFLWRPLPQRSQAAALGVGFADGAAEGSGTHNEIE